VTGVQTCALPIYANGDGVYAEDGVDAPDYRPEIAVSRISVSTSAEADRYFDKVSSYLTAYEVARVPEMLLLSNVATQFAGIDIDGAWYFEAEGKTLSLLPANTNVRRLYSTGMAGAETNTVAKQIEAIEQGYNIIVHSGHGGVHYLTAEFASSENMSGDDAHALQNTTYPIFLSSACEAGTFAEDDAAGERLMDAPNGGAIAYLGNSAVGLGLAGGMQIIDEMLRFVQSTPYPILGDALQVAHANMPMHDTFRVPVGNVEVPVVDESSYEWTQKSATMFGDILIPVWNGPVEAPAVAGAVWNETCEGTAIDISFTPQVDGVAYVHAGTEYYEVPVTAGLAALHLQQAPDTVTVGFWEPGRLATLAEASR